MGQDTEYLTSTEAARLLHVSPKTVSRWATEGRIACIVTLGGHRRFHRDNIAAVAEIMSQSGQPVATGEPEPAEVPVQPRSRKKRS